MDVWVARRRTTTLRRDQTFRPAQQMLWVCPICTISVYQQCTQTLRTLDGLQSELLGRFGQRKIECHRRRREGDEAVMRIEAAAASFASTTSAKALISARWTRSMPSTNMPEPTPLPRWLDATASRPMRTAGTNSPVRGPAVACYSSQWCSNLIRWRCRVRPRQTRPRRGGGCPASPASQSTGRAH